MRTKRGNELYYNELKYKLYHKLHHKLTVANLKLFLLSVFLIFSASPFLQNEKGLRPVGFSNCNDIKLTKMVRKTNKDVKRKTWILTNSFFERVLNHIIYTQMVIFLFKQMLTGKRTILSFILAIPVQSSSHQKDWTRSQKRLWDLKPYRPNYISTFQCLQILSYRSKYSRNTFNQFKPIHFRAFLALRQSLHSLEVRDRLVQAVSCLWIMKRYKINRRNGND